MDALPADCTQRHFVKWVHVQTIPTLVVSTKNKKKKDMRLETIPIFSNIQIPKYEI